MLPLTSNTYLALLAILLGTAQADAHRYHRYGRRLLKPSPVAGAFGPLYASPRGGGIFTSAAAPLLDVFQEVMGDIKTAAREFSDFTAPTAAAGTPPHEVHETADAAVLTVDLPGCKREDVDAQVSEEGGVKTLTVTAVRKKAVRTPSCGGGGGGGGPEPSPVAGGPAGDERASESVSGTVPAALGGPGGVEAQGAPCSTPSSSSIPFPSSSTPPKTHTAERFELSFRLGDSIDVSGIRGSLEDGVLTLVLPKLAPEPPTAPIEIPIDFAAEARKGNGGVERVGRRRESQETSSAADADTHISLS